MSPRRVLALWGGQLLVLLACVAFASIETMLLAFMLSVFGQLVVFGPVHAWRFARTPVGPQPYSGAAVFGLMGLGGLAIIVVAFAGQGIAVGLATLALSLLHGSLLAAVSVDLSNARRTA